MRDRVTEEQISAYLDGEVTAEERKLVERALTESAECRQLLEELRSLQTTLQGLPRYSLPADFSERVLREADRRAEIPAAEIAPAPVKRKSAGRKFGWLKYAAGIASLAAALLLAFLVLSNRDHEPVGPIPQPGLVKSEDVQREHDPGDSLAVNYVRKRQQLILVFDLAITQQGQRDKVFESSLRQAGIRFDPDLPGVRLQQELEKDLLGSRFIGNVQRDEEDQQVEAESDLQDGIGQQQTLEDHEPFDVIEMFYVRGTGKQLDSVYAFLWAHEHSHVRLDMGINPQETEVLNDLGERTWSVAAADHAGQSRAYKLRFRIGLQTGSVGFLGKFPTPVLKTELVPGTSQSRSSFPPLDLEVLLGSDAPSRRKGDLPGAEKKKPAADQNEDWNEEVGEVLVILRNLKEDLPVGRQVESADAEAGN